MQAVVEEGGLVRIEGVPFDPGTYLDVTLTETSVQLTDEEWSAFLDRHFGALADTDFEVPGDSPVSEIPSL